MRRPELNEAEKLTLGYDHASLAASATFKLYKVPVGRSFRLDRASYVNPTGLIGDALNAFSLSINNAGTVAALVFNTDTDDAPAGATLAADTFVEGALVAASGDRVFQAGEVVSAVFTEDGTATLPAGHLVLEGRLF